MIMENLLTGHMESSMFQETNYSSLNKLGLSLFIFQNIMKQHDRC